MEMSPAYMAKTAAHLAAAGWTVAEETEERRRDGVLRFTARRWRVARGPDEVLVLESLTYPDGAHAYYLEIVAWHGLTCTSFPLDSWKHHADRVELKYYTHAATGLGLSLVFATASRS